MAIDHLLDAADNARRHGLAVTAHHGVSAKGGKDFIEAEFQSPQPFLQPAGIAGRVKQSLGQMFNARGRFVQRAVDGQHIPLQGGGFMLKGQQFRPVLCRDGGVGQGLALKGLLFADGDILFPHPFFHGHRIGAGRGRIAPGRGGKHIVRREGLQVDGGGRRIAHIPAYAVKTGGGRALNAAHDMARFIPYGKNDGRSRFQFLGPQGFP